jgi:hypothetical protein
MIKHPIYDKDNSILNHLLNFIRNPNKLEEELDILYKAHLSAGIKVDMIAIMTGLLCFSEIKNNGHTLIKIKDEEWESDITKKTLEKLMLQDLKLPFKNGSIVYKDKTIFFAYMSEETINKKYDTYVKNKRNGIELFYIFYKEGKYANYITLESDKNIFFNVTDEYKDIISVVISTLLYTAMYTNDKERVKTKNIVSGKSNKLNIPKHNINQINLFQKINNGCIISREGANWKSEKRWLVRGHIRNQFYKSTGEYKLIFIDPYWKGDGVEEVRKVYNV